MPGAKSFGQGEKSYLLPRGALTQKKGRPTYANCAPISNEEVKCLLGLDGMVFLCLFLGGLRRLPVLSRDKVSCVSGGETNA